MVLQSHPPSLLPLPVLLQGGAPGDLAPGLADLLVGRRGQPGAVDGGGGRGGRRRRRRGRRRRGGGALLVLALALALAPLDQGDGARRADAAPASSGT